MAIKGSIVNLKQIKKELYKIDKEAELVVKYTLSDITRKAPNIVSKATASVYNIDSKEVARARSKSKNAGKQHVRTSFRGKSLDDFVMVFTGRKMATWATQANPMPERPKTGNPKIFSTKQKYTVSTEVFRGKRTTISPRGDNRVFVATIGGELRPMVVGKSNEPKVHASTSVPQAIMNKQVVSIWRPQIDEYVMSRFAHHSKQYWAGNISKYKKKSKKK